GWEKERLEPDGLFRQIDDRDGMEVSVGGSGKRATINSYMYGDAVAIAKIALLAGRQDIAEQYREKARNLKNLVHTKLWDDKAKFFKTLPRDAETLVDVREQHGYTPWYFNLPDASRNYEVAWKQLMDPEGFYAPYGPTTTEQRHKGFKISYEGHECQWNGPSWPMSTAITLTAMANVLNNYEQDVVSKTDYFETLKIYTKCHRLKREDGSIVPWIDENLNPHTGDWIARTRLKSWKNGTWDKGKGGKERGKDYNHSSYCDLIISGLIGLRPRADDIVEVNPLVSAGTWDWFCLDNVLYHGRIITILWDKTGNKYGKGKGLRIFVNGKETAKSQTLARIEAKLPPDVTNGMTYQQAKRRIPEYNLPKSWIGDVAGLPGLFEKLTQGKVTVIATTPGGRPMHLVTYGKAERAEHKANFNSAIGAREPAAYMNKAARKKPVILFVGPVHGAEVEGLTGLVNLINVMETGKDLRGKNQSELRALGKQCRLLIIPDGNPDGIARFEPRSLCGMTLSDLRFWGQGTWSDDTFCGWPQSKRQHPMAGDNVGFLGCYFNDKGINPMHDEFFDPMGIWLYRSTATATTRRFYVLHTSLRKSSRTFARWHKEATRSLRGAACHTAVFSKSLPKAAKIPARSILQAQYTTSVEQALLPSNVPTDYRKAARSTSIRFSIYNYHFMRQ
ncbi:MAG: MGH1-like glycoside hydrolase domain-containing protein, partial [Planctomycetota bacterium]